MNLHSDDVIDFGPRFCEPFSASRLEELYKTQDPDDNPKYFPRPLRRGRCISDLTIFPKSHRRPYLPLEVGSSNPLGPDLVSTCSNYRLSLANISVTSSSTRHLTLLHEVMPRWGMARIFQIVDQSSSHLACTLFDDSETAPDDRLRRAEIFCATNLMMQGIKLDRKSEFKVVPVGL